MWSQVGCLIFILAWGRLVFRWQKMRFLVESNKAAYLEAVENAKGTGA